MPWRVEFYITKAGKKCWVMRNEKGNLSRTRQGAIITFMNEEFANYRAKTRNEREAQIEKQNANL
jgi:hypothetical protein